jgi:hypothetical protein
MGLLKNIVAVIVVAILLQWYAVDAAAATFRWTDDRGVVHFSDDYKKIPSRYRGRVRVEREATPSVIPRIDGEEPREEAEPPRAEAGRKAHDGDRHDRQKRHHRKHGVKAPAVPVSPARRAQDQAEEQIRRDRQAIEDAQLPARKAQERAEEQIRRAREGTMGH